MSQFVKEAIPQQLITLFKDKRASLFIGAGLSIAVGLPDWYGLLSELIKKVGDVVADSKEYVDECSKILNDKNFLTIAEEVREKLGQDEFNKYIRERFVDNRPDPNEVFKLLVELPYNYIITTNYDYLIEDAYAYVYRRSAKKYTYQKAQAMADNIWNGYQFILKAHGDADEPDKIILTDKDYRNIINAEIGYKSILHVLFTTNSILFLGSSLTDPELNLLLNYLKHSYHDGGPTHYALMDKTRLTPILTERWRKDYGINIISYDPVNGHEQVLQFVQLLKVAINN
jgi:hypothetical protein